MMPHDTPATAIFYEMFLDDVTEFMFAGVVDFLLDRAMAKEATHYKRKGSMSADSYDGTDVLRVRFSKFFFSPLTIYSGSHT